MNIAAKKQLIWILVGLAVAGSFGNVAAGEDTRGYLYGTVETASGNTYSGLLRWGTEEAFWDDLFNSTKTELPYLEDHAGEQKRKSEIKVLGITIGYGWYFAWPPEMIFMPFIGFAFGLCLVPSIRGLIHGIAARAWRRLATPIALGTVLGAVIGLVISQWPSGEPTSLDWLASGSPWQVMLRWAVLCTAGGALEAGASYDLTPSREEKPSTDAD